MGDDDRSVPMLVMELVPGQPADLWFPKEPVRERIRMFLDVVDVVAELNENGVSHGDVHLGNVIVREDGHAILIDPEAELFGSTVARRLRIEGPLDDLRGLRACLEALVQEANPNTAKGVLERLGRDDLLLPTARDIGRELRALLAASSLPGESSITIDESASRFRAAASARVQLYRENYQMRDLEFRHWRDRIVAIAERYKLKTEVSPTGGAHGLDSPLTAEQAGEDSTHGTFMSRSVTCETPDGDKLHFGFQAEPEFRRPWPGQPGLLSKGYLSVVIEGVSEAVVFDTLELWARGEKPILVVASR